jgi:hypothetical protein
LLATHTLPDVLVTLPLGEGLVLQIPNAQSRMTR